MIRSFPIFRGKTSGDKTVDFENVTAIFKGSVKIYLWPLESDQKYLNEWGSPLEDGVFQSFPKNGPLRYLLRVYCVRALGLRPKDISGKSDPYLHITLNDQQIVDKEHVITRNVNPVFGR